MRNCLLKFVSLITMIICNSYLFFGQSKEETIALKKGDVFDVLLLTQNTNAEAELKSYIKNAFPVAKRMSYQALSGFKIINHTQGNIRPQSLLFGKWGSLKNRKDFLTQIIKELPDFNEQRRNIWTFFGLQYFEIKNDLSFKINRDKYNVVTVYWLGSKLNSSNFYKKWKDEIEKMRGDVLVQLKDGKSPFGYLYNPDFLVITSWENEKDFKAFQNHIQKFKLDNIEHINEFILK